MAFLWCRNRTLSVEVEIEVLMNVYVQMDHPELLDPRRDSTLLLCHEAQKRGFQVFFYSVKDITVRQGDVQIIAYPLKVLLPVSEGKKDWLFVGQARVVSLDDGDVVLMRQNPPFDMSYITGTYALDLVRENILVVNHPRSVRDFTEKLFCFSFPDLMPPSIVTQSLREAEDFRRHYHDVVLKPLYGYGGGGVIHVAEGNDSFRSIFHTMLDLYGVPLLLQKYIPAIKEGDTRVVLFDGEVMGAYKRVPSGGDFRSNVKVGGDIYPVDVSDADLKICLRLKEDLQERGLFLVGVDIIDGHLIEVNVTSPAGIAQLNELYGRSLEVEFWDRLIGKYDNFFERSIG